MKALIMQSLKRRPFSGVGTKASSDQASMKASGSKAGMVGGIVGNWSC